MSNFKYTCTCKKCHTKHYYNSIKGQQHLRLQTHKIGTPEISSSDQYDFKNNLKHLISMAMGQRDELTMESIIYRLPLISAVNIENTIDMLIDDGLIISFAKYGVTYYKMIGY